ncbi:MAG TPA: efflux RND transporter permease subunit [Polyangiaceae bacterium]
MWLTRLALRNPILILMLSLMLIVLGGVSLQRLSVDLFPDITIPTIQVATFYTGAGPADIEKSITEPIERAVSAAPGVDRIESKSRQGVSVVTVWFGYGVDLNNAQFEVQQRVAQILNTLPPGIQQPFILKFDITNIPVAQVAVRSDTLDEKQLRDLAYNTIEPQLERIQGVASASVGGGKTREVQVLAKRDALFARGLGILDVVNSVKSSNLLLPSGNLRAGDRDYNVFSNAQFQEIAPIGEVVVRPARGDVGSTWSSGSAPVRVSDVAEVVDGTQDQTEVVRINGKRGVYLRVLKQPGANTIAVVDALRKAIPNLRGVPDSVKTEIGFDQSTYIRSSVAALQHEAVQGGLLAIFVILVFLLNLRATGIVAVAIPLSIVTTFVLLYFTGQTLNVFTLGGLALGVGRLVDDSIVELENIHRHLERATDPKVAVLAAAQEVAMPILVSTITTIVVFFPVLFMFGIARYLFLPLALTISFALMTSFFVSRTVTPLLCYYWMKPGQAKAPWPIVSAISKQFDRMDEAYGRALGWVLRNRLVTVVSILVLCGSSLLLGKKIGTEFFPETDESQFTVSFRTPIGTRVERSEVAAATIEEVIRKSLGDFTQAPNDGKVLKTVITSAGLPVGRTAVFTGNTGSHAGSVSVNLISPIQRQASDVVLAEKVRAGLREAIPGTSSFFFTGGIVKRILNFGSAAPIDVEVLGYELDDAAAFAQQIAGKMRGLFDAKGHPILTDVQLSREENAPELDVDVDRQKAGMLGITEQDVSQTLLTSLVGNTQFSPLPYTDPKTGNQYFINVRMEDAFRDQVSDLSQLFVRTPRGSLVSIDALGKVRRGSGPVMIERKYLQRVIHVTANVAPTSDLGAATQSVTDSLAQVTPPDGFTAQLGGQSVEQAKAFKGMAMAGLLALALVYMVLASEFKSLLDPLIIICSVPLGISGVLVTLYLTGTKLSVNSFMGVIMMIGIVVSNGVLLVAYANQLQERGRSLFEATIEAGRTRLRPILMTTIATVFGLLPMALGIAEGSETNLPLARAVIGGLTVSTFFTLFLIPALYTVFDRFAKREADVHEAEAFAE